MNVRLTHSMTIACALMLGPGYAQAQADAPADAAAQDNGPQVLRGSAAPPFAAPPVAMDPGRWQVAAGDELWLVEPAGGVVVACALLRTSKVGHRVISCETGRLPRIVVD